MWTYFKKRYKYFIFLKQLSGDFLKKKGEKKKTAMLSNYFIKDTARICVAKPDL